MGDIVLVHTSLAPNHLDGEMGTTSNMTDSPNGWHNQNVQLKKNADMQETELYKPAVAEWGWTHNTRGPICYHPEGSEPPPQQGNSIHAKTGERLLCVAKKAKKKRTRMSQQKRQQAEEKEERIPLVVPMSPTACLCLIGFLGCCNVLLLFWHTCSWSNDPTQPPAICLCRYKKWS